MRLNVSVQRWPVFERFWTKQAFEVAGNGPFLRLAGGTDGILVVVNPMARKNGCFGEACPTLFASKFPVAGV